MNPSDLWAICLFSGTGLMIFALLVAALREEDKLRSKEFANSQTKFDELANKLLRQPLDRDSQAQLFTFCTVNRDFSSKAYSLALSLVEQSGGEASIRDFAFRIGLLSYSHSRHVEDPSFQDKQAIQKHIQARCEHGRSIVR